MTLNFIKYSIRYGTLKALLSLEVLTVNHRLQSSTVVFRTVETPAD